MKYILDSSIAVKWELTEIHSDKANLIRADFRQGLHDLLSPEFFPFEVAHALTRAERQGRLKVGQAGALWADTMLTAPALVPCLPLASRAIEISSQTRSGAYDCVYLALAEQESCEFITADDRLVNNLQKQFPFIRSLSSF